ncbi:serine/threonine-protein kinase [Sorangium sp. So ce861]|uniref:serine/threonine-protein kinase n=1 Tax=Sorangium sp. So ce861 TaxID=3133323 RepID=UPI003F643E56
MTVPALFTFGRAWSALARPAERTPSRTGSATADARAHGIRGVKAPVRQQRRQFLCAALQTHLRLDILGSVREGAVFAGHYIWERRAGAGGMGEVWKALDQETGQPVAVKLLPGHREAGDAARFAREARILSALEHAHVVRYVAHGADDEGAPYLVMEWLEGEDLAARLRRGPLGVNEGVALALRVADALSFAHARGVVHRDLKPSNLFLPGGRLETVQVLDFGIARAKMATRVTGTGMLLGTPGYMAPEQARGEPDIEARADVFSLGCVLFECLTGEPAFGGEHLAAILEANGQHAEACAALAKARERLFAIAERIGDPKYRASFLESVPENRRTLDLARQWLGERA